MGHSFPKVTAAVRTALAETCAVPTFHELLQQLMAGPGRALSSQGSAKWPAFMIETCQALGGNQGRSVWAAAAVEFAAVAAEVVDDLVDEEWNEQTAIQVRSVNASSALIWLAQRNVTHSTGELDYERAWRISNLLVSGYLDACAGEDLDLVLETPTEVTEEQAHKMTRRRSGSLVAMACHVGAAVATDDPAVLDTMARFGSNVGLAAQLLNDLADINSENPTRGTDLRRKKTTLPAVYALRCAQEEGAAPLLAWYRGASAPGDGAEQDIASMIRTIGGLRYGWVVAETHRREALATLNTLAHAPGRSEVHKFRHLVPKARLRPA